MKIKTKLFVLVSITLLLILSITTSLGFAYWRIEKSLNQELYIIEIQKALSSLSYHFRQLAQPRLTTSQHWDLQNYRHLTALLENPPQLDAGLNVILSNIIKNHDSIYALYGHLHNLEKPLNSGISSHLVDKLFNQIETIRDDSYQLSALAINKIDDVLNRHLSTLLVVTILSGLFLISISIWLYKGIVLSLSHLHDGLTATSRGDYDFSAVESGEDEISDIARLFNIMQDKLNKTTISKQQLQIIVDEQTKKLKKLSETDTLTRIPNRRAYTSRYNKEKASAVRNNTTLAMLMIDIDHFKEFNDGYGHEEGDKVLYKVAQSIKKTLPRDTDFTARFGGEEFVVLLPNTSIEGSIQVVERIAENIKSLGIQHQYSPDFEILTVSIGVASLKGKLLKSDSLLKLADQAMYQAKKLGRNQYQIYQL